jgi:hypothetical protein
MRLLSRESRSELVAKPLLDADARDFDFGFACGRGKIAAWGNDDDWLRLRIGARVF